jgi:hypothetical protein
MLFREKSSSYKEVLCVLLYVKKQVPISGQYVFQDDFIVASVFKQSSMSRQPSFMKSAAYR